MHRGEKEEEEGGGSGCGVEERKEEVFGAKSELLKPSLCAQNHQPSQNNGDVPRIFLFVCVAVQDYKELSGGCFSQSSSPGIDDDAEEEQSLL